MIFDDLDRNVTSGKELGLPLSMAGWGPRKLFIANRGVDSVGFTATFIEGSFIQLSLLALFGFMLGSNLL